MLEQRPKTDPRKLTSLPAILSCTSEHHAEEDRLTFSLAELLASTRPLIDSLNRVNSLAPSLEDIRLESEALNQTVSTMAKNAARIEQYVRVIDEEMGQVKEAAEHVTQTMELKESLHALQASIENQNWESATRHCARAMSVSQEVLFGLFAETVVPNSTHHLPPSQMLQASREQLLAVFVGSFRHASQSRDSAATSRFFKMFPSVGFEKEGLQEYSRFIVELIRSRVSTGSVAISSHYYSTALATLLENIATIVHQHQPVVDKYYGRKGMKPVLQTMLDECDEMVERLLQKWEQERLGNVKIPEAVYQAGAQAVAKLPHQEASSLDPREIDDLVSEMALMVSRWNLFTLFVVDLMNTNAAPGEAVEYSNEAIFDLSSTRSHQLFGNLIQTYYIPLELRYLCCIIDKAHHLSEINRMHAPETTTMPDDIFYVLKVIMKRSLSLGSVEAVKQALEGLRDTMDHKYVGVMKNRIDDSVGIIALSRTDKAERGSRFSLMATLNDLDVSESHLQHLVQDIIGDVYLYQYLDQGQQTMVKQYISSFTCLKLRLQSTLRAGLEALFNQALKPRLRNLIPEVFKDVSYVLNDEAYTAMERSEIVRKRFAKWWESIMDGYQESFTERNFGLVFEMAIEVVLRPWEKVVTSTKFNELGAIRFDCDLRSVISYLCSQTSLSDVREKFVRLQQISMLLNLDGEEDLTDFYNGSGIPWQLTLHEARTVIGLRT